MFESMNLKILLPFGVASSRDGVTRIIVETSTGSYGFYPNRLDCVADLVPGIVSIETNKEGVIYTAVDEGIFIKIGNEVTISVRNAIEGNELGKLRETVEKVFLNLEERERNMRTVLAKLESNFVRNFNELIKNE